MSEQIYNILEKLIVKNGIRLNNEELKLQLSSHPSYPSMHAITGVLDHFGIPNLALRLPTDKETLVHLPVFFLANVSTEKGEQLALIEKRTTTVKIIYDKSKRKTILQKEFLEIWNGVIIAIEKDETIEEFVPNRFAGALKWIFYSLVFFMFSFFLYAKQNLFVQAHFMLSVIGLFISVFIVKHELGLQSETANNFCNLSSKTSCDAVLNSKGALMFGVFKLSDVSFVVFSTYCLCWALYLINGISNFSILLIVTLLAFPFIIYSLYYQYKVVEKWCPLCLSIALVLILQIGMLFFYDFSFTSFAIEFDAFLFSVTSLILVASAYSFVKPLLEQKQKLQKIQVEHYKFKHNFSLFNVFYKQGKTLKTTNSFPGEIILGDKNAPIKIFMITSPLCYFCKKAHSDIESLLKKMEGKISVAIRFNVDVSNKDSALYGITSKLIEIYKTSGESVVLAALQDVYSENADHQNWLQGQTYPISESSNFVLIEQYNWCKTNAINFTPDLYINDKQFPKEYNITDLTYFIDELIEAEKTSNSSIHNQAIAS